ncbi:MAG: hypothetical protein QXI42_12075 [Thermoproteota archaeon]
MGSASITTIKVRKRMRRRLAELGAKGESYDGIVNRLIDFYLENSG